MKAVIVLGATGLVGSALVEVLSQCSQVQTVVAVSRKPVNYTCNKVENLVVDFEHLEEVAHEFNADALFSCLGTTLKQAGSVQAQRKVDLDYQLEVAKIAVANGVKDYFLVSSSGANPRSSSAYFKMKGELEQAVKALGFEHIHIFQPSLLVGERADFRLAERIASYVLPVVCLLPGLRRYRPIRAEQVALKMAQIATGDNRGDKSLEVYALGEVFPS